MACNKNSVFSSGTHVPDILPWIYANSFLLRLDILLSCGCFVKSYFRPTVQYYIIYPSSARCLRFLHNFACDRIYRPSGAYSTQVPAYCTVIYHLPFICIDIVDGCPYMELQLEVCWLAHHVTGWWFAVYQKIKTATSCGANGGKKCCVILAWRKRRICRLKLRLPRHSLGVAISGVQSRNHLMQSTVTCCLRPQPVTVSVKGMSDDQ